MPMKRVLLQAGYDLAQAMRHADRIKVERLTPAT
jgi:hypothetical protein